MDEVETELLRARSVHDTVREFLELYAQPLGMPVDDEEREAWLLEMQRGIASLNG